VRNKASAVFIALAVTAGLLPRQGSSAEIKSIGDSEGRITIAITGKINLGDTDVFAAELKQANDAKKIVATVSLNSVGGNLLEGVKLADAVRFGKISTNVEKMCASACFLVFAAGSTKVANYAAQIGVHGASDISGAETVQSNAATVSMAKIAKKLGVPAAIIGRMVVTPPSEMVWLSPADLQSMGTTMVGKPDQVLVIPGPTIANQTPAGAPMPLHQGMPGSRRSWATMTDNALEISKRQNGGTAKTLRSCQPREGICNSGVLFKMNGKDVTVLSRQNIDGKIIQREICTYNDFDDVRACMNWDTNEIHRDMKNSQGVWAKVADYGLPAVGNAAK
jgi:hypothetical protein